MQKELEAIEFPEGGEDLFFYKIRDCVFYKNIRREPKNRLWDCHKIKIDYSPAKEQKK